METISVAGEQAGRLSRQLHLFSRGERNHLEWFDPNERLSGMRHALTDELEEDVDLDFVLGEDLGEIHADPVQFDEVVGNLIRNAGEAMPGGGRVVIETATVDVDEDFIHGHLPLSPGPHLLLKVTDTGTGMTPEVQSHLFEPFFTTKAGKEGFGLATVYAIVRDAGGSITASSQPNRSATFHLIFPRIWRQWQSAAD